MTAYPFEAEVRLLRWAESSNAGRTVTFELPPGEGEAHPFRGLPTGHQQGQRFRMLFQAIDDSEEPILKEGEPKELAGIQRYKPPERSRDPGNHPESRRPDEAHSPGGFPPQPPTPAHPADSHAARKAAAKELYASLDHRERAVALAAIFAGDELFQRFASKRSGLPPSPEMANAFIKSCCGVGRKREIALSERAFVAWQELKTEFEIATGRFAEPRR